MPAVSENPCRRVIAVSPEPELRRSSRARDRIPSPFRGIYYSDMRKTAMGTLVVAFAAVVLGAAAVASAHQSTSSVVVKTAKVKGLGTVLVNSKGFVLYMFAPDHHSKVTCTGSCAVVWPPLKIKAGAKAKAGGSAKASLLGSDKSPAGYHVVTYKGWPLYTYVADTKPGQANGQAKNLNGGFWYVLSPSGAVIKKK